MDGANPGAMSNAGAGLSTPELEAQITELAGHLNAANRRWLALIAEFDRRKGWNDGLTQTCAHWLNWKCGIDIGAAREKVRVAHALEQLPAIGAAMARGELSYSKVRALTRVACPATEQLLLGIALHGTAHHVETIVRQFRRVQEAAEVSREARQHANRRLTYHYDDDGSLVIKAHLPAETGALVLNALEAAMRDLPLPQDCEDRVHVSAETSRDPFHMRDVSAETPDSSSPMTFESFNDRPSPAVRRADALGLLAESFLKHGPGALSGGERHQIVVHLDAESLHAREAGRCELDDGPAIPIETVRRLSCDASVVKILENGEGEPLTVGRKTRTIPPALRRALKSRDQGCVFPGCTHKRYVDGHHIHHWAEGGETKLSNLVSLCRRHHRAVHEGGTVIQRLDDGAWRFVKRSGEALHSCAPGHSRPIGDWMQIQAAHATHSIHIDANTSVTRWRGERMDHVWAIDLLVARVERANTPAQ
jgi:5-methylcytosine-specific restriction endonuclease McrA